MQEYAPSLMPASLAPELRAWLHEELSKISSTFTALESETLTEAADASDSFAYFMSR